MFMNELRIYIAFICHIIYFSCNFIAFALIFRQPKDGRRREEQKKKTGSAGMKQAGTRFH